jgi:hypothetical protein
MLSKVEVKILGCLFWGNRFVIDNSFTITEADQHDLVFDYDIHASSFSCFLFPPVSEILDFFVGDFSNLFLGHSGRFKSCCQ